jgi:hypothetical protein
MKLLLLWIDIIKVEFGTSFAPSFILKRFMVAQVKIARR